MKHKILIISSMLILLLLSLGITYSFFHSSTTLEAPDQKIAKFIFNAETTEQLEFSLIDVKPGDNLEYAFSVSNNESENVSDVSVDYQLTINTYHLAPLDIEIYKVTDLGEDLVIACDETYSRNLENELVCDTSIQTMLHSAQGLDNYKLKVSFPTEYNDVLYSGLVDYINLEIRSWQKIEN